MIASVRGTVVKIESDHLVVEVGGVGLKVFAPRPVLESLDGVGRSVTLHTHLIVREDLLALYGFSTEQERALFETLLGVSGIGPKAALAVMSNLSADVLRSAVSREEPELISRIPGIGKKTAEKLVFHLKGKLGPAELPGRHGVLPVISDVDTEVLSALTALGFSVIEAQAALQSIPRDAAKDVETRVELALRYFAGP